MIFTLVVVVLVILLWVLLIRSDCKVKDMREKIDTANFLVWMAMDRLAYHTDKYQADIYTEEALQFMQQAREKLAQ